MSEVKRWNVRWDGSQCAYYVDQPMWSGGEVVLASDYDAVVTERDASQRRELTANEACRVAMVARDRLKAAVERVKAATRGWGTQVVIDRALAEPGPGNPVLCCGCKGWIDDSMRPPHGFGRCVERRTGSPHKARRYVDFARDRRRR